MTLYRIKLADNSAEKLADGLGAIAGLAWDHHGRLYISDSEGRRLLVMPHLGDKPVVLAKGFRDSRAFVSTRPASNPGRRSQGGNRDGRGGRRSRAEVDETPMPVETAVAFPDLQWEGWNGETDDGKPNPQRPIVLTHAGDGSNRIFVADEHGVVYVFPNDPRATQAKIFLDLRDRVVYDDKTNEEGFLGMAFHPKYKENGEIYIYYTTKKEKHTNVLSRFKVRKDDPNQADPASEEVLLRVVRPYWFHDGGWSVSAPTECSTCRSATAVRPTTPTTTARTSTRSWAKSYASTWTTRQRQALRDPQGQPLRARPASDRRYGLTDCATSGGCRSTARRASCGRRTWAKISLKRST